MDKTTSSCVSFLHCCEKASCGKDANAAGLSNLHYYGLELKAVIFAAGVANCRDLVMASSEPRARQWGEFLSLAPRGAADPQVQLSALYALLNPGRSALGWLGWQHTTGCSSHQCWQD